MKHAVQEAHVEAYIRELVGELVKKAMQRSNEEYSVFVDWMPQVRGVTMDIHPDGYNNGDRDEVQSHTVYLDWDDAHQKLKSMIEMIK